MSWLLSGYAPQRRGVRRDLFISNSPLRVLGASVVNYPNKSGRSKSMKTFLTTILAVALVFLSVANLGFVKNAEAIIGMPWTPMSYAGVARRSMYREAVAASVAATALAANAAAADIAYADTAPAHASSANTPPAAA